MSQLFREMSISLALERVDAISIQPKYDAVVTLHSWNAVGVAFAQPIGESLREEFSGLLSDMDNYNSFIQSPEGLAPIKGVTIDVPKLYDIEQVAETIALHLEDLGMRVLRRDDRDMPRSSVVAFSHSDSLRLDAKKVLTKIGGKRPGKKCKGSYISADKKCSDHSATTGSGKRKLSEAGKRSAMELAARVRERKGMGDKRSANFAKRTLAENLSSIAGAQTEKQLTPMMTKLHKEARKELNDRRAGAGLKKLQDKPQLADRSQQALRVIQGGKAKQPKALQDMSLGELFKEADRVGNKYQSKDDPIDLGAKREAAKILDETGFTKLKNKAMGVATIGKAKTTTRPIEGGATASAKRIENANPQFAKKRTTRGRSVDSADEPVRKNMGKFKRRTLNSGSKDGPIVTSRKQAIAIALSVAGKSK